MKCLVYLIILVISVNGEFQYFKDSRASASTVCTSSTVSKTFCASASCGSNELIICLGPSLGVSVNCSDQFPFCIEETPGEAKCTESCGSDFSCTGEGIFPDPLDCKKYHFCQNLNNNLLSQSYSCPDRYVFDPDAPTTNYCRYTNNFYCTLPKCGNSNEMKNVLFLYPFYPYNRQYVALCIPSTKPLVFKCQDGFVADLSTIPVKCNFKCKSPGLFPNPEDSTKYYECYYNSNRQLVMRPGSCFAGYIFVNNKCVLQSTIAPTTTNIQPITTSTPIQPITTTIEPTNLPTNEPTNMPTNEPTNLPTNLPTIEPTNLPTNEPTNLPTNEPTNLPTNLPTIEPTNLPTNEPTNLPTNEPTNLPTNEPTNLSTNLPTIEPTNLPTNEPTNLPTNEPTNLPTNEPTNLPTNLPTIEPTNLPTNEPTNLPTNLPTIEPTNLPTNEPTNLSTNLPTNEPTNLPTNEPTENTTKCNKPLCY